MTTIRDVIRNSRVMSAAPGGAIRPSRARRRNRFSTVAGSRNANAGANRKPWVRRAQPGDRRRLPRELKALEAVQGFLDLPAAPCARTLPDPAPFPDEQPSPPAVGLEVEH